MSQTDLDGAGEGDAARVGGGQIRAPPAPSWRAAPRGVPLLPRWPLTVDGLPGPCVEPSASAKVVRPWVIVQTDERGKAEVPAAGRFPALREPRDDRFRRDRVRIQVGIVVFPEPPCVPGEPSPASRAGWRCTAGRHPRPRSGGSSRSHPDRQRVRTPGRRHRFGAGALLGVRRPALRITGATGAGHVEGRTAS
jgi:hypothetical protein